MPTPTTSPQAHGSVQKFRRRNRWLISIAVAGALLAFAFWQTIQIRLLEYLVLRNDEPSPKVLWEIAEQIGNPAEFLLKLWRTPNLSNHQFVLDYLRQHADAEAKLFPPMEFAVLAAAHDVNLDVRDQAFSLLARMKHRDLPRLAREQLADADPAVRALGLQILRSVAVSNDVPAAIALLSDRDPRVVVSASSVLRSVTGKDFGIRQTQAWPMFSGPAAQEPSPDDLKIIRQGVERWQEWWTVHHTEYPSSAAQPKSESSAQSLSTPEITLQDLSGHNVRLSDFRGKTVLLSFWEPANPLSQAEISTLKSLQAHHEQTLAVVGISFTAPLLVDCCDTGDEQTNSTTLIHPHVSPPLDLAQIRTQMQQFVNAGKINYPVFIDEKGTFRSRFCVQEVPTYVLLDAQGNIRRRFEGSRTESVFAAMIDELTPIRLAK